MSHTKPMAATPRRTAKSRVAKPSSISETTATAIAADQKWLVEFTDSSNGWEVKFMDENNSNGPLHPDSLVAFKGKNVQITSGKIFGAHSLRTSEASVSDQAGGSPSDTDEAKDHPDWQPLHIEPDQHAPKWYLKIKMRSSGKACLQLRYGKPDPATSNNPLAGELEGGGQSSYQIPSNEMIVRITIAVS
jgi:hypothetical protein